MASCNSTDILATAYRNGYAKLSSRDLMVAAIASACSTCNAQPLIETAIGLGYLKLSEFDTAMCIAESLCSSPGVTAAPAPTILKLAIQDHLAAMSRRDLDGVIAALLCKMTNPPCVTPATPGTPSAFSTLNNILKISWAQPPNSGSLILNYTVSYGTTQGGPYTSTVTVPAMTKQAVLSGLTSGTAYYFVVKANSFSGCSSANSSEGTATTAGTPAVDPAVTSWQTRVIANGGASPSAATLAAADTFWKGVKAAGLDTKIIHLNFIAPDSYIAAITPFIVGPGLDPWNSIQPLLAGDLGINGFTGNGSKFMDTGCITSTIWAANNGALIVYDYTIAGAGAVGVLGSFNQAGVGGGGFFELNVGGTLFAGICDPNANLITHAAPVGNGYYCISRLNSTDERLYFANSTNPHAQIALQAGLQTAVFWAASNYFMALNTAVGGAAARQAPDTLSFAAIAQNWSATDDANMYPLVQALRTSLGGGFR